MRSIILGTMVSLAIGHVAIACPYSIRDAGFAVREPDLYLVAVFESAGNPCPPAARTAFEEAAADYLPYSNADVRFYDVDDMDATPDSARAVEWVPQNLPAAILISPAGRALELPPIPTTRAKAIQYIHGIVYSPVQKKLLESLVDEWCVVLVVEGTDGAADEATAYVDAAGDSVVGARTEMGRVIEGPPPAITARYDDASERVLLWSLNLLPEDDGADVPTAVGVVFGIGRRVGPIGTVDAALERRLRTLYRAIGQNCTCISDPSWLLGPAAPMVWDVPDQERIRDDVGFDPNNPMVMTVLSGVWPSLAEGEGWDRMDTSGYSEIPLD